MTTEHSDVAAELWALAETVLTRVEPMLRQAVADQQERPRQGCSWCPVCALSALIRGEQHDLLTVLATEGATVIAMIRQLVAEHMDGPAAQATHASTATTQDPGVDTATATDGHGPDHPAGQAEAQDTEEPVVRRGGFVPITVTVKDPV
ncbi:hypothetical protein [Rhodococcus sp. H29-C3]|uniref:hypothetical protein n=1 Tax=Rhodococcus sp. H29-C3 TaxID=3046307 RepID=UPI0024BAFC3C|nr:hypothetical protein [Rhodococcus sp. H29-C3]MDJ0360965.1 hypothetical protein [Rhodococcus sp. H29-C3]